MDRDENFQQGNMKLQSLYMCVCARDKRCKHFMRYKEKHYEFMIVMLEMGFF